MQGLLRTSPLTSWMGHYGYCHSTLAANANATAGGEAASYVCVDPIELYVASLYWATATVGGRWQVANSGT